MCGPNLARRLRLSRAGQAFSGPTPVPHATELPSTPITAREPGWKRLHPPPRGDGRDGPPSTSAGMSLGKTGMGPCTLLRSSAPVDRAPLLALELLELSRELERNSGEKATECVV